MGERAEQKEKLTFPFDLKGQKEKFIGLAFAQTHELLGKGKTKKTFETFGVNQP